MLYVCIEFRENVSKEFRVIEGHQILTDGLTNFVVLIWSMESELVTNDF